MAGVDRGQGEVKEEASRKARIAPMEECEMKREDEVREGMRLQWMERSLHHPTSKWMDELPDKQSKVPRQPQFSREELDAGLQKIRITSANPSQQLEGKDCLHWAAGQFDPMGCGKRENGRARPRAL